MSTSKEMSCGGTAIICDCSSAIRYTCAYKFTARVKSTALCFFFFVVVLFLLLLSLFCFVLFFFLSLSSSCFFCCPFCILTNKVYGRNAENEPVSRIKMADNRALVSMGTLYIAIFETRPLYEKRQI